MTVLRTFGDSALARVALIGADPRDDEDLRLRKALLAPGQIQVTRATYELLRDDFVLERRGTVSVKGKGEMETWYLVEARDGKISGKIANEQPNGLLDPATAA